MLFVLSDQEAAAARERQIENVAKAIHGVLRLHAGTNPLALTAMLAICGTDFGLLSDNDLSEARRRAAQY